MKHYIIFFENVNQNMTIKMKKRELSEMSPLSLPHSSLPFIRALNTMKDSTVFFAQTFWSSFLVLPLPQFSRHYIITTLDVSSRSQLKLNAIIIFFLVIVKFVCRDDFIPDKQRGASKGMGCSPYFCKRRRGGQTLVKFFFGEGMTGSIELSSSVEEEEQNEHPRFIPTSMHEHTSPHLGRKCV